MVDGDLGQRAEQSRLIRSNATEVEQSCHSTHRGWSGCGVCKVACVILCASTKHDLEQGQIWARGWKSWAYYELVSRYTMVRLNENIPDERSIY